MRSGACSLMKTNDRSAGKAGALRPLRVGSMWSVAVAHGRKHLWGTRQAKKMTGSACTTHCFLTKSACAETHVHMGSFSSAHTMCGRQRRARMAACNSGYAICRPFVLALRCCAHYRAHLHTRTLKNTANNCF